MKRPTHDKRRESARADGFTDRALALLESDLQAALENAQHAIALAGKSDAGESGDGKPGDGKPGNGRRGDGRRGNRAALARALRAEGLCRDRMAEYNEALELFERALPIWREVGDVRAEAEMLIQIARSCYHMGAYDRALQSAMAALGLNRAGGDRGNESRAVNQIGNVHYARREYRQAREYYLQCLAIDEEIGDRDGAAAVRVNVGLADMKLGSYDEAIEQFRGALEAMRKTGNRVNEAFALNNIGSVLRQLGRFEEAVPYYRKALTIRRRLGLRRHVVNSLYSLGYLSRAAGDPVRACRFLREALREASKLDARRELYEIHIELALAYGERGMYREAFRHHQLYHELEKAVFNEESNAAMQRLMVQHNTERVRQQSELFRLRSERLELVLANRSQELAAAALNMVQRNEFLAALGRQLAAVAVSVRQRSTKRLLDDILRRMNESLDVDEQWKLFTTQLTTAHGAFLSLLARRYPGLRATELKVCSLLRLQLGTKEIASLLNVGVRDVEKHRLAIRRRLGLATGDDLVAALVTLDSQAAEEARSGDVDFLEVLRSRFPLLTPAELRLCSLLRLNLSTREMARILSLSTRSVENHRYNIRRKLGIDSAASLVTFLAACDDGRPRDI